MSRAIVLLVFAALSPACADPVHDMAVAALGPEDPNVPPGPLHRPGQPCVLCHDGTGPARFVLSVGGTVYEQQAADTPVMGATVVLFDSKNRQFAAETNCVGNFFVQPGEYAPDYPMYPQVHYQGLVASMRTHVGRDGSCATCHTGHPSPSSVDHVYLSAKSLGVAAPECP
jgi:hypothetical protein